jgi:hypothetical protein
MGMRKSVLVSCVALGAMAFSASAQDQPRGGGGGPPPGGPPPGGGPGGAFMGQPPLSPEKAKAAWEFQGKGVASSLGLTDEQTAALVKAYTAARTSHGEASEKLRKEMQDKMREGGGRDGFAEMQEKMDALNKSEREKLQKALLAGGLTSGQTERALTTLGSFSRQWDGMADAVIGFNLEAGKLTPARKAMEEFVATTAKARESGDREAMRDAMQEARKKLSDTMKGLLTEEQFGKFEASMGGMRGRGPGGPGGGGDRPQRGGGGGG